MKVNKSHHDVAKGLVANGTATKAVQDKLIADGLTKSQAHDVTRWQRKKAGKWKVGSGRHFVNTGAGFVHVNEPEEQKKQTKSLQK